MSFTLVRVGTRERPASPEDIEDIKNLVIKIKGQPDLSLVTHHAIDFEHVQPGYGETIVYHLGEEERPASPEDIEDFQKELASRSCGRAPCRMAPPRPHLLRKAGSY
jgi:hypothetical protein